MMRQSGAAGSGSTEWLIGSVKQNPEGLLLVAAGLALLMRTSRQQPATPGYRSRDWGRTTTDMDRTADPGFSVGEKATSFASSASETASSFASSASEYATQAKRTIGEQSDRIVRSTQTTLQGPFSRILQEQPLVVAVAGLAAGAAIAAAFPSTDIERQTLGPLGDRVSGAAARVGEQLQEATSKVGETLKNAADERGLNTDGLKEVVTEAVGAFSETMGGKKDDGSSEDFESPPLNPSGSSQHQ
jgi:hypothetical protein